MKYAPSNAEVAVRGAWRQRVAALVIAAAATGIAPHALAQQDVNADLELSRVAIFSSGVAFYEWSGTVQGDAYVDLTFRTEQINDILKSLVVQDLGGGSVSVVEYASQDPIERTLGSFAVDITNRPSMAELFDQLRGEPIAIEHPRAVRGTILGVETQARVVADQIVSETYLNIVTDAGLMSLPVREVQGVKLENPRVADELRRALATLAGGRDADKKTVRVNFRGAGERDVRLLYLLEAPIWKTSYRLVLDEDGDAYLQGWAVVENATEADWNDVQLSLVSGRPISFTMDLYTPLYVPRPEEQLERYVALRPRTYEGDLLDSIAGNGMLARRSESSPAPARAQARLDDLGFAAESAAVGRGAGRIELSSGLGAAVAEGADAGELFEYTLREPISIARQNSAMLPIIGSEIKLDRVSIFSPESHPKHPLNGVYLTNSSGLSLMQGPVTVYASGTYAGDAKLPNVQAGEKRLLSYALDIPVEVSSERSTRQNQVAIKILNGSLIRTVKSIFEQTYTITNRDDTERTVVLEQPKRADWKLIVPSEPDETTDSLYRIAVRVPAGDNAEQKVRFEQIRDQSIALRDLNLRQVGVYLRGRDLSPALRTALEQIRDQLSKIARLEDQLREANDQVRDNEAQQARSRENLKVLDRNTDAYARQLRKFDAYETEIEQGRARARELEAALSEQRAQLQQLIRNLKID